MADADKERHRWGQNEDAFRELLGKFDPDMMVCDPFVGGGTTALVRPEGSQFPRKALGGRRLLTRFSARGEDGALGDAMKQGMSVVGVVVVVGFAALLLGAGAAASVGSPQPGVTMEQPTVPVGAPGGALNDRSAPACTSIRLGTSRDPWYIR